MDTYCQTTLLATGMLIILAHGCIMPFGATDKQYQFIVDVQKVSFVGALPLIAAYMMLLYNTYTFTLFADFAITWSLVMANLVQVGVLVWLRLGMPRGYY